MQLGRHHDNLTVRDETIVAHPDGSTVDVMDVKGSVKLLGNLYVETLNWYQGDIHAGGIVGIGYVRHLYPKGKLPTLTLADVPDAPPSSTAPA